VTNERKTSDAPIAGLKLFASGGRKMAIDTILHLSWYICPACLPRFAKTR